MDQGSLQRHDPGRFWLHNGRDTLNPKSQKDILELGTVTLFWMAWETQLLHPSLVLLVELEKEPVSQT